MVDSVEVEEAFLKVVDQVMDILEALYQKLITTIQMMTINTHRMEHYHISVKIMCITPRKEVMVQPFLAITAIMGRLK